MLSYLRQVCRGPGNDSSEQQRGGSAESFPGPLATGDRGWRRGERRWFLAGTGSVGVGGGFVWVVAADRGAARRRRVALAVSGGARAVARARLGEVAVVGRPADLLLGF